MSEAARQRVLASARTLLTGGVEQLYFQTLGARCRVSLVAPPALAGACFEALLEWVGGFEGRFSREVPDSVVSRLHAAAGRDWIDTDPEFDAFLEACDAFHRLTQGVFDPTSGPLSRLWQNHSGSASLPDDAELETVRREAGWWRVRREPGRVFLPSHGMRLDLEDFACQHAVDALLAQARQCGVLSVRVDVGRGVATAGDAPDGGPAWQVGLEDPCRPGQFWGQLRVRNAALATTCPRRVAAGPGQPEGPFIDVRSGRPVAHGARAVSVLAPTCTRAGALATAACILGPAGGLHLLEEQTDVAGCLLTDTLLLQTQRFHEYLAA